MDGGLLLFLLLFNDGARQSGEASRGDLVVFPWLEEGEVMSRNSSKSVDRGGDRNEKG